MLVVTELALEPEHSQHGSITLGDPHTSDSLTSRETGHGLHIPIVLGLVNVTLSKWLVLECSTPTCILPSTHGHS